MTNQQLIARHRSALRQQRRVSNTRRTIMKYFIQDCLAALAVGAFLCVIAFYSEAIEAAVIAARSMPV